MVRNCSDYIQMFVPLIERMREQVDKISGNEKVVEKLRYLLQQTANNRNNLVATCDDISESEIHSTDIDEVVIPPATPRRPLSRSRSRVSGIRSTSKKFSSPRKSRRKPDYTGVDIHGPYEKYGRFTVRAAKESPKRTKKSPIKKGRFTIQEVE